jgi:predicted nucleic acid-binding protein
LNYLDSSALVKRFIVEKGSDRVEALIRSGEPVATAKIAYAEIYAGLARRRREGDLSEKDYTDACRQFEGDWRAYVRVDLRDEVLVLARDLIRRHPLRGYDSVHLASAIALSKGLEEKVTFLAADVRLLRAARSEKLRAINPES